MKELEVSLGTLFPPNNISGLILQSGFIYFSSSFFPIPKLLYKDSQVKQESWPPY
jgi:hypothetical protein